MEALPTMNTRSYRRSKGFTFLEIMFVVVIIGILLALVGPRLAGRTNTARISATQAQIRNLETALKNFEIDMGTYPKDLEELTQDPDDVTSTAYNGPYMDGGIPTDQWDNPFKYETPGKNNRRGFDLWSMGPDGQDGTEDDITNWQKKS